MSNTIEDIKRKTDKKIIQLQSKDFLPVELVGLVSDVSNLQLQTRKECNPANLAGLKLPTAEQRVQGKPLLLRSRFQLDMDKAQSLFNDILDLSLRDKAMAGTAQKLVDLLEKGELDSKRIFKEFLSGNTEFFTSWSERFPESPKLLDFLVQSAAAPQIEAIGSALGEQVKNDTPRVSGECPVCGSLPLISTLKEKEGFRFMTCSFCKFEYRVPRIACPFCGENDPKKLRFFKVDEEPGFRVDVCDSCNYYIKTIDFRALDNTALPVLDDLASLPLDFLAGGQGYKRATFSAWGF